MKTGFSWWAQRCFHTELPLKQDDESPPDSWLLFLTRCSDLHVESSFTWAIIKQNSIIYLFASSINKIKQAFVYLVVTLSHRCPLAKTKIRCSESISKHRSSRIQAAKKGGFTLIFVQLNISFSISLLSSFILISLHSSFLGRFKSSSHSTLSFSNSISFNSEVQFSARTLLISYRFYLQYLQLSHQPR